MKEKDYLYFYERDGLQLCTASLEFAMLRNGDSQIFSLDQEGEKILINIER